MSYKVKLNIFEGPFDLLVYLIENAEMSIYDIKVSEITSQYLGYIRRMEELDIAVGAEFLVLAATLIELKSKMLLPRIAIDGDEEEDPRADLAQRLLEYARYKKLAGSLEEQLECASCKLPKPQEDLAAYTGEPDEFLRMDMGQFIRSFRAFLYKKQKSQELRLMKDRVGRERISVDDKKSAIAALIAAAKDRFIGFKELLTGGGDRYDKVVTFVSILEMVKAGGLKARQGRNFSEIRLAGRQ